MKFVLVFFEGRWRIGRYCIDEGEPGVWLIEGRRAELGYYGAPIWQELPPAP